MWDKNRMVTVDRFEVYIQTGVAKVSSGSCRWPAARRAAGPATGSRPPLRRGRSRSEVSQTQSVFCVAPRRDGAGVRPTDHRRDGRQKRVGRNRSDIRLWGFDRRRQAVGRCRGPAGDQGWVGGADGGVWEGRPRRWGGCNAHTPPDTGAGRGDGGTGRRRTVCGHDESRIAGRRAAPTRPSTSCICPS